MTSTHVIGVGHRAGGDDRVGPAVITALAARDLPDGVRLSIAASPCDLPALLAGDRRAVIVDAVVGAGPPGTVLVLDHRDLAPGGPGFLSSHGFDVPTAVALAHELESSPRENEAMGTEPRIGPGVTDVCVVAIAIDPPVVPAWGLSPPVARAVSEATEKVIELCREDRGPASVKRVGVHG